MASSSSSNHPRERDRSPPGDSTQSSTRPRQTISIALPSAGHTSAAPVPARRPLEAFSADPPSASILTPSRPKVADRPTLSRPVVADKVPPFFYKPLKSKDFKVEYDPALDTNPIKKGKVIQYRYDGHGLADEAGSEDPRGGRSNLEHLLATAKRHPHVKRVAVITYNVRPCPSKP